MSVAEPISALASAPPPRLAGAQRLLLPDVSWASYRAIGAALADRPALRLTYDRGLLEIMTTSREHEFLKKRLTRLLEMLLDECRIPFDTAGNMTFQREDLERALEPDDCFWIAHEPAMRGRTDYDPTRDPPPDLVLEIEVSRSALDRMGLYASLGVPEVWRFDGEALHVHRLQPDGGYAEVDASPTFPSLPLQELARFVRPDAARDSVSLADEFRAWVRQHSRPK